MSLWSWWTSSVTSGDGISQVAELVHQLHRLIAEIYIHRLVVYHKITFTHHTHKSFNVSNFLWQRTFNFSATLLPMVNPTFTHTTLN